MVNAWNQTRRGFVYDADCDNLTIVVDGQNLLRLNNAGGVELLGSGTFDLNCKDLTATTEVVINEAGGDIDLRVESDCVTNLLLICAAADNIKIAGTAAHATTPGTQSISIFAGTAPNGTLACGATLFAGCDTCVIEIRAEDSGGTATTL